MPPQAVRHHAAPVRWAALLVLALVLPARHLTAGRPAQGAPRAAEPAVARTADRPDFGAACRTAAPYFAVALLSGPSSDAEPGGPSPDDPAIVAFGGPSPAADGADEGGEPLTLATRGQVGDVYGLGTDASRGHLYAAAYLRVGGSYGPGGPGQIYRIDLASGAVEPWAALPAGPDRHGEADGGALWVGRTGLGDLDVDAVAGELHVVNLYDRRVYRLALPDGAVLGSFRHGGQNQSYGLDMRPFGLGVSDGWVYHGETNGQESGRDLTPRHLVVYRSRPDGSQMQALIYGYWDYPRPVPWSRWTTSGGRGGDEPMVVDIAFGEDGDLLVGLRDRQVDVDPGCVWDAACSAGASGGDLLPAAPHESGYLRLVTTPAWFQDWDDAGIDLTFGALAKVPGVDLLVSPGRPGTVPGSVDRLYAHWFAIGSGARLRSAPIRTGASASPGPRAASAAMLAAVPGDAEVLCGPRDESGGAAGGTATAEVGGAATATAQEDLRRRATRRSEVATQMAPTLAARSTAAAGTAVALVPTLTAAAVPKTVAAAARTATLAAAAPALTSAAAAGTQVAALAAAATPERPAAATANARAARAIESSCGSGNPYLVTTRFVPRTDGQGRSYDEDWMSEQAVLIALNDTVGDDLTRHYNVAREPQLGAVFGLAYDLGRRQLYVGAYLKRLARFGQLGPGGIYRYDLATGRVLPFARLEAGHDPHRLRGTTFDQASAAHVGLVGLGDLELWPEGDELLVVNLADRLIYRLSVPDGRVLGAFAHGAAAEPWAADAVPFGLGIHDGWLFHGVTDTAATPASAPRRQTARVYRSRPDGSRMTEVARLDLAYARSPAWQPWAQATPAAVAEPLLTDIEFREDGDLVLGLRNRQGDAQVMFAGDGDMVLTSRLGDRWFPMPDPELYNDTIRHPESSWGTLASLPWLDEVVSTAIDPIEIYSGGIAWFSNRDGAYTRLETVYAGGNYATFGKASGLGDVESLCEVLPPPPTETPTSTSSATSTASPTASPTASVTATATRSRWTIYLPLLHRQPCIPEERHADVALVLDMSTSMYRSTLSNRTKHEAAIEAARLFVDELDLDPGPDGGRDRVAVVGFNDLAWTQVDLTSDARAVGLGLDGLTERIAEGTRLDLALAEGMAALQRAENSAGNPPVLVLLTDGLPNRVPTPIAGGSQEATVASVADAVKAAGIRVFTIGLGLEDDVLDALLADVASQPDDYYFAPDGEDLAAIYRLIAGRIVECP